MQHSEQGEQLLAVMKKLGTPYLKLVTPGRKLLLTFECKVISRALQANKRPRPMRCVAFLMNDIFLLCRHVKGLARRERLIAISLTFVHQLEISQPNAGSVEGPDLRELVIGCQGATQEGGRSLREQYLVRVDYLEALLHFAESVDRAKAEHRHRLMQPGEDQVAEEQVAALMQRIQERGPFGQAPTHAHARSLSWGRNSLLGRDSMLLSFCSPRKQSVPNSTRTSATLDARPSMWMRQSMSSDL